MINCNPETVSTDYDTSDRLYFEPLTIEDVLAVVEREKPLGVLVQFGGQTPLKLAHPLAKRGRPDSRDDARRRSTAPRTASVSASCSRTSACRPRRGPRRRPCAEGMAAGRSLGFPLLVRPSYVLGGRAMRIAYDEHDARADPRGGARGLSRPPRPDRPVPRGRLRARRRRPRRRHGDRRSPASCSTSRRRGSTRATRTPSSRPYRRVPRGALGEIRDATAQLGKALKVVGLMNVQYAIKDGQLYVLEVNPRASRTVPFVAKATGVPFARLATRLCLGESLRDVGLTEEPPLHGFSIKAPVFPFRKFEGVDTILGPEMRSTGEVMGHDRSFGLAFLKAALGAGIRLPEKGTAFLSVHDGDKEAILPIARELASLGFTLLATSGTARALADGGLFATPRS